MRVRFLGRTDLRVSELGMGCAALGGDLYHADASEASRTLEEAFDAGICFFDTGDIYQLGVSERLIGRVFRARRDRVTLATKGGALFTPLGRAGLWLRPLLRPSAPLLAPFRRSLLRAKQSQRRTDFSARHLTEALHASLRRLRTDYVDLYQLHHPSTEVLEAAEYLDILERLKGQGKIRACGVSCDSIGDAFLCLEQPSVDALQITLNLLEQQTLSRLVPLALEKGVGVIARLPLGRGLLTDQTGETKAERLASDPKALELRRREVERLRFLVTEGRTLAQAALRFALQQPGVSVTLAGMSSRAHLRENLGALRGPALTADELERCRATSGVYAPPSSRR